MGTFCTPRSFLKNPDTKKVKEIFEEMFENNDKDDAQFEDYSVVGNIVYAGMRLKSDPSKTFVMVVRFSMNEYEVCYKRFSDSCGPRFIDCPEKILKYAEGNGGFSPKWIEECRAKRNEKAELAKMRKTVKVGDTVKIDSYDDERVFVVAYPIGTNKFMLSQGGVNVGSVTKSRIMEILSNAEQGSIEA